MTRVVQSVLNIVASLLLGAVAFALTAIYASDTLFMIQDGASSVEQVLLAGFQSAGAESNVMVWIRFLVSDQQLVFLGFVILMRVLIALLFWMLESAWAMVAGAPRS